MTNSNDLKNMVKSNSNKGEIKKAFNEAIKAVKELEEMVYSPANEAKRAEAEQIIKSAHEIASKEVKDIAVVEGIKGAINSIDGILEELNMEYEIATKSISEAKCKFDEINAAIKIQEEKMKNLLEIDKVFMKLSDLIAFYNSKENELKEHYNKKLTEVENELIDRRKRAEIEMDEIKKKYDRNKNDFNYEFDRTKRIQINSLNDELALKRKAFNESMSDERKKLENERNEFEENVSKFEKEKRTIEDLEEVIKENASAVEVVKAQAYDEGKQNAKKSFNYELTIVKKEYEAKLEVASNNIKTLTDIKNSQSDEISKLTNKLEAAYAEIKDIANTSMRTSADKNQIDQMQNMMKSYISGNDGKK